MSAFTERHRAVAIQLGHAKAERAMLKTEIRQAIAWGRPDRESTGCTADEFISLLHSALKEIESLEAQLEKKS